MLIEWIFLAVINHPFDEERPTPADHPHESMSLPQPFHRISSHPAMDCYEVNALVCLTLNDLENIFHRHLSQSLPLADGLNGCLIDRNGSYRNGRMADDLFTDGIDISTS